MTENHIVIHMYQIRIGHILSVDLYSGLAAKMDTTSLHHKSRTLDQRSGSLLSGSQGPGYINID